jgi:thiosulfate/3-mercaptopyruvate sulfurtransferase
VLVTTGELLAADDRPVLLDVRWALGDPHGRERYLTGHLPGAVFVDLESELADPPQPALGRHPMPSLQRLQAAARRWGISVGSPVVAYDDTGGLAAARGWWLLRWGGLTDLRLLDGGLAAWVRAGGGLEPGDVVPEPGDVVLTGGALPVLAADDAAALPGRGGVLLDARAGERFRGEVEPVDPRAGHVPGATSAPTTANLAADGTFLPAAELADRFAALGVEPGGHVGVYCGSGVTAAHEVAALAVAGIDAALWPGSWSQWSADPARPVATGG